MFTGDIGRARLTLVLRTGRPRRLAGRSLSRLRAPPPPVARRRPRLLAAGCMTDAAAEAAASWISCAVLISSPTWAGTVPRPLPAAGARLATDRERSASAAER